MMSLTNKLLPLKEALLDVSEMHHVPVYHYWRPAADPKYILWEEDGESSALESDNHKQEQSLTGVVDYYTFDEFDPVADAIQENLNTVECLHWTYDGTTYEDDTNYIHHTWRWNIL